MNTLEQHLKDHGVDADDAAFYAAHTEKWLRGRAVIELELGEDHNAAVIDAVAYETRERAEA
jgi:hypothetical protein